MLQTMRTIKQIDKRWLNETEILVTRVVEVRGYGPRLHAQRYYWREGQWMPGKMVIRASIMSADIVGEVWGEAWAALLEATKEYQERLDAREAAHLARLKHGRRDGGDDGGWGA